MEKIITFTAVAAPMLRANIDTDAIIPSREMKSVSKTGLASGLFAGWRYKVIGGRELNPDFILNKAEYKNTRILIGGDNFGCGSSREHAVWALHEYGIRAIIAPSFSPIFYGNCIRNGIVPVRISNENILELVNFLGRDPAINLVTVDLRYKFIISGDFRYTFEIESEARDMLLEGLNSIDLTLKNSKEITEFRAKDSLERPWVYLDH